MKKILLLFLLLFLPLPTLGAEFYFAERSPAVAGQTFRVDLVLDSQGETLNAVAGQVVFPSDELTLSQISYGETIVSFWVEQPVAEGNFVKFSGIIPGGYLGRDGVVLSLWFLAPASLSKNSLEMIKAEALLSDGLGTAAKLTVRPHEIKLSEVASGAPITADQISDVFPPEPFNPEIVRTPEMYDNNYFLVFSTQDKNSGIIKYEILETSHAVYNKNKKNWEPEGEALWVTAESPYVLSDQKLQSYIFVRAIDRADNVRTVYLLPEHDKKGYNLYYWTLLLLLLVTSFVLVYYAKNKNKKTRR
jgi:hypothetical protein